MKLIFSHLDLKKKINIIYSLPNQNVPDGIIKDLRIIYNNVKEDLELKRKIIYDYGSYLTCACKINSAWYDGTYEVVMLTLYFEEHENTRFFKGILDKTVSELSTLPNLSKVFYINTPHADGETYTLFGKVIQILKKSFFEANKLHATYNLGIAEVLILGEKKVGKTAIVDYLIHEKYIPQAAPTLTPQVYNLVYNETDFRVLDICCEQHLKEVFEDHPIEPGKLPQAIVYVIDATLDEKDHGVSIAKFNEWMDFLQSKYKPSKFHEIPILVLFNKIDLNSDFNFKKLKDRYQRKNDDLNIKYDTVSALSGKGLLDNFEWLVKRVKVTEKL
jgi:GTPase SAR1 family protein